MISIYVWIIIIILIGWAIARFAFERILKSEKDLSPEHIHISVCPVCGSLDNTTTAENAIMGFNLKCRDCKYVGTMLEMNLIQAKKYSERKRENKLNQE